MLHIRHAEQVIQADGFCARGTLSLALSPLLNLVFGEGGIRSWRLTNQALLMLLVPIV